MGLIPRAILDRISRTVENPQEITSRLRKMAKTRFWATGVPSSRPANIAMFHIGRCGSTVLGDMLDQHPGVYWDGEVYEPHIENATRCNQDIHEALREPVQILKKRIPRSGKRIYGFEIKFYHLKLAGISLREYVGHLKIMGFNHFVLLDRKNSLKKIVSSLVAHEKKQYHQPTFKTAQLSQIRMDVNNVGIDNDSKPLVSFLQDYENDIRELTTILDDTNLLRLSYEEDISGSPKTGYAKVCDFLNLKEHPVKVKYGRTNPFGLREMISNFEDVEEALLGTQFEWMLYE